MLTLWDGMPSATTSTLPAMLPDAGTATVQLTSSTRPEKAGCWVVRRNDSFVLQRIQQTEMTLFERPDSGHPPGTQTDVLLVSHSFCCVVHGVSWTCKLLFVIVLATLLRHGSQVRILPRSPSQ